MGFLLLGLLLFLGMHSVRIVADDWRSARRARWGALPWKGVYSLVSVLGFALILWGYGQARLMPLELWQPPLWTRHLAALLTLPAFVLLAAAHLPGTRIKARLKHPMLLGVKLWAAAHLLANGSLSDLLLFGSFLIWAVFAFRAARQRDRAEAVSYPPGRISRDVLALVLGTALWLVFAFRLHALLIGVSPFGI